MQTFLDPRPSIQICFDNCNLDRLPDPCMGFGGSLHSNSFLEIILNFLAVSCLLTKPSIGVVMIALITQQRNG